MQNKKNGGNLVANLIYRPRSGKSIEGDQYLLKSGQSCEGDLYQLRG